MSFPLLVNGHNRVASETIGYDATSKSALAYGNKLSIMGLSVTLFPMLNVKVGKLAIRTWRSVSFTNIPKNGDSLTLSV